MKTEESLSATVEEYLEAIYNMSAEDEVVIGARLAEKFHVSAPTVTEMLKRLVRDGYIEMDTRRQVTLTEAGNQTAVRLSTLANSEKATILLISEVVEDEEALILYLHDKGLTPGKQLTVLAKEDESESADQQEENFKLLVEGHEVCISKAVAGKIWVTH